MRRGLDALVIEAASFSRAYVPAGIPTSLGGPSLPLRGVPWSLPLTLRSALRGLVNQHDALRSVDCPAASLCCQHCQIARRRDASAHAVQLARLDVSKGASAMPLRSIAAVSGRAAPRMARQLALSAGIHSSASLLYGDKGSGSANQPSQVHAPDQQQQQQPQPQQQQPPQQQQQQQSSVPASTTSGGSPGGKMLMRICRCCPAE